MRSDANLWNFGHCLPFCELAKNSQSKKTAVTIIEINAEPTPLTYERISDYHIQEKTGQALPKIVDEVKRLLDKR